MDMRRFVMSGATMSIELLSAIASAGTFIVIAATAVAAFVQLRHLRGTNSITALTECREVLESDRFRRALEFVAKRLPAMLHDPDVRARITASPIDEELSPITIVGNFFEALGSYVQFGIVDRSIACALWAPVVVRSWDRLVPALAIMRREAGPMLWEQFEYLASISMDFIARHPYGIYPNGVDRLRVDDAWIDADARADGRAGGSQPGQEEQRGIGQAVSN
jgi:hypothetical protein